MIVVAGGLLALVPTRRAVGASPWPVVVALAGTLVVAGFFTVRSVGAWSLWTYRADPAMVSQDVAWTRRQEGQDLTAEAGTTAAGAERPLPNVGSLPIAVRVRGAAVDILTEKSWYTGDGGSITPRAYDPAR